MKICDQRQSQILPLIFPQSSTNQTICYLLSKDRVVLYVFRSKSPLLYLKVNAEKGGFNSANGKKLTRRYFYHAAARWCNAGRLDLWFYCKICEYSCVLCIYLWIVHLIAKNESETVSEWEIVYIEMVNKCYTTCK